MRMKIVDFFLWLSEHSSGNISKTMFAYAVFVYSGRAEDFRKGLKNGKRMD